MSILSFGQFAREKKCQVASDWSNQEVADFFRAHKLLVQNGASIGMDRGRSDIGEPWMAFYDTVSQDVFLHIARIDEKCILVCEHLGIHLSATRIDGLINKFEEQVRQAFSVRTERHGNVVVHPAAKIIMSISAVFLLFKMDSNSQTLAKEALNPTEVGARKVDSVHLRLQATLARLFDGAETPVAMAALASVILASEMALGQHETNDSGGRDADQPLHQLREHDATLQFEAIEQAPMGDAVLVSEQHIVALQIEHTLARVQELIAIQTGAPPDPNLPVLSSAHLDHTQAVLFFASGTELSPVAPADLSTAVGNEVVAALPSESGAVFGAVASSAEPMSFLALDAISEWDIELLRSELASGLIVLSTGEVSTADAAIDLGVDQVSGFGFEAETHLADDELTSMLEHIISNIGSYELGMNGGVLSIIQLFDGDTDVSLLGSWTNIMSDGSSIEIIGSVGLIDDVAIVLTAA